MFIELLELECLSVTSQCSIMMAAPITIRWSMLPVIDTPIRSLRDTPFLWTAATVCPAVSIWYSWPVKSP